MVGVDLNELVGELGEKIREANAGEKKNVRGREWWGMECQGREKESEKRAKEMEAEGVRG